jgi:hypothetical protein
VLNYNDLVLASDSAVVVVEGGQLKMSLWIDLSLGNTPILLRSKFYDSHRNWPPVLKMNRSLYWESGRPAVSAS